MHLCILISNTCPSKKFNLTIGGAEKQVFRLLPEYEKNVERLSIITKFSSYISKKPTTKIKQGFGSYSKIFSPIINHVFRKQLRFISIALYSVFIFYNLIKIHHRNRIDILNIHMIDASYYPISILAKILGIKIILKPSSVPSPLPPTSLISRILFQLFLYFFKKVILLVDYFQSINLEIKEYLKNVYKIPENKIVLIPNGIDTNSFKDLYNPGCNAIGYVGRLDKIKNIPTLIGAFSRIIVKYPQYTLKIYGDGPERKKIENKIRLFNLQEKAVLYGFESDYQKMYTSFDIFILPSFSEGISNSLLEAMAAGIPIIASYNKGNVFLINDGLEGLIFNPFDIDDLTKKIFYCIENPTIEDTFRMNACLKVQNEFDIQIIIKKLLYLMKSILIKNLKKKCA